MLLFFVRHGDPNYSTDSLTPQGELQAAAVAKRLARYGIDRIYSSSAGRAIKTAEPTARLLGLNPIALEWMNEKHAWKDFALRAPGYTHEHWAFQTSYYIRRFNSPEVRALGMDWTSAPEFAETRFAEGVARVQAETDSLIASLGYVHDRASGTYQAEQPNDNHIAIFAHQGFGMIFLSCLLDQPFPHFSTHFDMGHSGMTVIEFCETSKEGKDPVCVPKVIQLSNDSHLYAEGLPTVYQNRIRF